MTSQSTSASSTDEPASSVGPPLFELWAGPFSRRDLAVVSFTGREALSRLFSFEVLVLAAPNLDLFDASVVGNPATLVLQVPDGAGPPRLVRGIVAAVRSTGTAERKGRHAWRVRIAPKLWLLKRRIMSRVFQNRTVPDIVATVLDGWGISHAFSLSRAYPTRAYCVQHQESDYAFVARLLAEEGIFYTFQHPSGVLDDLAIGTAVPETVVLGDSPQAYSPLIGSDSAGPRRSPTLHLRESDGFSGAEDDVPQFSLRRVVRPGAVLLRDYDFQRPQLDLRSEARTESMIPDVVTGGFDERTISAYEHRGEYDEAEVNPARAKVLLEQRRRRARETEGTSRCRRLEPGRRFRLEAEARPQLEQEYAVTWVEHQGHTPELAASAESGRAPVYENRFACVPAELVFRPKRPRRVLRQVLESATVVGPAGEEIYTDAFGRIKVQFHWDLEGRRNEHSSCWLRVIQAWAGSSWGAR